MSVPEGGDYDAEMRTQNDYLWQQYDALRKAPRKTWRRHRLHEVVCGGCGRTLVEVMDTRPYPIVVHRRPRPDGPGPSGWGWFPISDPAPNADDEQARRRVLVAVCDCQRVTLPLGPIFDALRAGEAKRVLPGPAGTLS